MRKPIFQSKPLILCLLVVTGLMTTAVLYAGPDGPAPQELQKPEVGVPVQTAPEDNASFKGYPTTLTLEWKPVEDATSYDLEIDCLGCDQPGKWGGDTGEVWKQAPGVSKTKYTFIFAGHYKGKWRVRASKGFFTKGEWSTWRNFEFDTKESKKTALQACGIVLESLDKTGGAEGDTFVMYGVWGSLPGQKVPCLKSKDKIFPLSIRIWSENIIRVKIPAGIPPGKYKAGVYCLDPQKEKSDSSDWLDFEVTTK